jgi:hypothetical protein
VRRWLPGHRSFANHPSHSLWGKLAVLYLANAVEVAAEA